MADDDDLRLTQEQWERWWREGELDALAHRVRHWSPTPDAVDRHREVRAAVLACGERLIAVLPPGAPESTAALVALTDAVMGQANAAVARHVSGAAAAEELRARSAALVAQLTTETEAARHVEELGG